MGRVNAQHGIQWLTVMALAVVAATARSQPRSPEPIPKLLEAARTRGFTLEAPRFDARAAQGKTVVYLDLGERDEAAQARAKAFASVLRSFGVRVVTPVLRRAGDARVLEARAVLRQHRRSTAVVVNSTATQNEFLGATAGASGGQLLHFWTVLGERASLSQLVQVQSGFDFSRIGQTLAAAALERVPDSSSVTTVFVDDRSVNALMVQRSVDHWLSLLTPSPRGTLQLVLRPDGWREQLRVALEAMNRSEAGGTPRVLITLGDEVTRQAASGIGEDSGVEIIAYPLTRLSMAELLRPGPVRAVVGVSQRWLAYAMADQALRVLVGAPRLQDERVPAVLFDRETARGLQSRRDPEPWFGAAYEKGYGALWSGPRFVPPEIASPAVHRPIIDEEDDPYARPPLRENPPECPATYAEATGACGESGLRSMRCEFAQGACSCAPPKICTGVDRPPPTASEFAWRCDPWPPAIRADGCPGRQPRMGTICRGTRECAYGDCGGVVIACEQGHWQFRRDIPPPP